MLFEEAAREYMDDKGRRLRACTLAGYESALALHKVKPDASPAVIYVDTIVPLSSL